MAKDMDREDSSPSRTPGQDSSRKRAYDETNDGASGSADNNPGPSAPSRPRLEETPSTSQRHADVIQELAGFRPRSPILIDLTGDSSDDSDSNVSDNSEIYCGSLAAANKKFEPESDSCDSTELTVYPLTIQIWGLGKDPVPFRFPIPIPIPKTVTVVFSIDSPLHIHFNLAIELLFKKRNTMLLPGPVPLKVSFHGFNGQQVHFPLKIKIKGPGPLDDPNPIVAPFPMSGTVSGPGPVTVTVHVSISKP